MSKGTQLAITLNEGRIAPRYGKDVTEIYPEKAVITEQGMESGLPLVDIQLIDADGKKYYFMLSGRVINGLSAAIKGVNLRNHGKEEL